MPPEFDAFDAEREKLIARGHTACEMARRLTRELRQIDPYLSVVFIDASRIPPPLLPPGIVPQRWHVRRRNPETLDIYFPIVGPNDAYAEPTSKLIEDMKAADLWRQGALQELRDRQVKAAEAREKRALLTREQLRDDTAASWRAAKRLNDEGGLRRRARGRGKLANIAGH